jgi:hypothetical protein
MVSVPFGMEPEKPTSKDGLLWRALLVPETIDLLKSSSF